MVDRIVEVPQVQDLATLLQIACHAQEILENSFHVSAIQVYDNSSTGGGCAELILCLCRS